MKLVTMIPAYNEEATIAKVIKNIPKNVDGIDDVEVLVIDDGSTDNTLEKARIAGAKVIAHGSNKGLGQAFRTGIESALVMGADIIVNIDADGQFNPKDIPKLVEPIIKNEADMVTVSRFRNFELTCNMPLIRKIGNKAFTSLINMLTKSKFTDTQCGFRAYSREAALKLNLFGSYTYTQEVFLDLINKGLRIKEVPTKVTYKKERKSRLINSLSSYGFRTLKIIMKTTRDHNPLRFFGIPGVVIFSIGFIGALFSFVFWLSTKTTSLIKTTFSVSIFLLTFGFLLIILALMADMFKRTRLTQEEILYLMKKENYKEDGSIRKN